MSKISPEILTPILQEGSKLLNGIEQVLYKNIKACIILKNYISSSFGPDGLSKVIEQKIGNTLVTSDTATIINNLAFIHPSAKIISLAALSQEQESGDSAGFVVLFATELLTKSYDLIKQGFSISTIIDSFEEALETCLDILETLAEYKISDISDTKTIASLLSLFVDFRYPGLDCYIAPQIAYACVKIYSCGAKSFSTENIRVVKILGGNFDQTKTIMGTVIIKDTEGSVKLVKKANVAIFLCDFIISSTETKNSIMFKSAQEILSYSEDENYNIEEKIRNMAKIGINVIISSGFSDISLFYMDKYNIMALKIQSKFDLKRISRTCNSSLLAKIKLPNLNEIGHCESVSVKSFGLQKVTVFQQEISQNKIFTVVARANSTIILDNIERTIHKTTSIFKSLTRDSRFVPGAGASEIEIYRRLTSFANKNYNGHKNYLFQKFAEAFEIIPITLIENSGQSVNRILSQLHYSHSKGYQFQGVNINQSFVLNTKENGIWDLFTSKYWAIRRTVDAVTTILTTSQIIMSKQVKVEET
nr:chaperonin-containing-TCP1 theta subunit [Cryptomonas curvata]|mmetsp:Transcript_23773/g.49709  ORF Transcript_23773/g.49709 Transcript_23773/m.49709 type:complete len:533 (+) Transcript_23773:6444-8042(+)